MTFYLLQRSQTAPQSHPQGQDCCSVTELQKTYAAANSLFPSGQRGKALCFVGILCHPQDLAEHKGYSYRQAVLSCGFWLYSLLYCEKGECFG